MISDYKCIFGLKEGKSTSVTQKQMPSQREQYGSNVHLFIGTGRSICKITPMPFTFANDSIVTHRGLNSLFRFKSVSFCAIVPKLPAHSFGSAPTFVSFVLLHTVVLIQVRRYMFMHFTPETLLNHIFEDLRKSKAPTIWLTRHEGGVCIFYSKRSALEGRDKRPRLIYLQFTCSVHASKKVSTGPTAPFYLNI
jgi:hypothetical protein